MVEQILIMQEILTCIISHLQEEDFPSFLTQCHDVFLCFHCGGSCYTSSERIQHLWIQNKNCIVFYHCSEFDLGIYILGRQNIEMII